MSDAVITTVKLSLAISAGLVYVVAINVIIAGLIQIPIEGSDFITESFNLLATFLPFDYDIVMVGLFEATTAIIAFLISQHVYKITMLTYKVA